MPSSKSPRLLPPIANAIAPPWYYRAAIGTLKPLYRLQVHKRSAARDNYHDEVAERFGSAYRKPSQLPSIGQASTQTGTQTNTWTDAPLLWCHAVSLGETNTVAPLLDVLLGAGYRIWLTNTTQTGHARTQKRFAEALASGQMQHSYVPVDAPTVIKQFLAHVQPAAALFVETELWANTLYLLNKQHIPSILVNGRLSEASFTRYQKIAKVSASMMHNLTCIIAQDEQSATRFKALGAPAEKVKIGRSLKWVINGNTKPSLPESIQNAFATIDRPIWVAASTHEGEEQIALDWQQQLLQDAKSADALLILVPRHPERFDAAAQMVQASGLSVARRSLKESIQPSTQVYLADTMGELMAWYQLADVALVGGSLVDVGGHNPVEPAGVGTPVLMGSYTYSCQEVVDELAAVGALQQATAATDTRADYATAAEHLYPQLFAWLTQPERAIAAGQAGAQLTEMRQSALTDQLGIIDEVLTQYSHITPLPLNLADPAATAVKDAP
ncbi:3-deoxy-D-manno-octulosonic acid transferase [Psychrobacter aestuarii]|uniref:3-deoxy-D-manno-octulosonic acid transferase n=1 Tax=Psychrobacter aestuarii TaxID=556327 RepID=A0ABN0VZH4_9GAMM|nr:3-deoxy-D-manno-octulosonic acid transferase [Psychrobacter aestuarii]